MQSLNLRTLTHTHTSSVISLTFLPSCYKVCSPNPLLQGIEAQAAFCYLSLPFGTTNEPCVDLREVCAQVVCFTLFLSLRPNVWTWPRISHITFHSPVLLCWPFHCTQQRERPGRRHARPYRARRPQSQSSGTEARVDRHECEAVGQNQKTKTSQLSTVGFN